MSDTSKAVFLSYASQDAEAAKKICDALRAAGVEVWFDQSELVGGDAWDAKIRGQISSCALFVPVISANTQARLEGYFRLEWKLAAQRTHTMADEKTFLLPIVIDATRDGEAKVPAEFKAVQWTKLAAGETPPAFAARVKRLLEGSEPEAGRPRPAARGEGAASPAKTNSSRVKWWWALPIFGVALALLLVLKEGRKEPAPTPASTPATPTVPQSEADQLVRQARDLIYDPDSARNEFALAENLLKRATDLAPASGAAWGASALLAHYFYSRNYDVDRQRLVRSQAEAEKALRLDPRNTDALLALGLHRQALGDKERAQDYLDRALAADPQNFKALLAQSQQLSDHSAKAKFLLEAADRVSRPAELLYYAAIELGWAWRFAESEPVCERAIVAQPFWRTYVQRAVIVECLTADPAAMNRWLDKVPESKRDEPRVAFMRFSAAMLQRDGAAAVRALNSVAADYLEDSFYTGPRAFLLAQAHELAGQPGLAAEQWQLAERVVREKLAADPGGIRLRAMLAVSLAGQHRAAEAMTVADACAADDRIKGDTPAIELTARAYARLGEPDRAIELLRLIPAAPIHTGGVYAANLEVTPLWDALRDRPGYARLLEELRRAEHREGGAPAAPAPKVDDKSVAVLAFANLSDDKANEYFSDGISEELLNVLAKIPGLKVTARTSSFHFKGTNTAIPEIAQQLGVAYVVEGSVRKQGDKVRITAQLIKGDGGFHVWSDTFTRDLKDIFAVQDEIAGLIAKNLELKMGIAQATRRAVDPEAYRLYLEALPAITLRTLEGFDRAEALINRAIERDPGLVPAQAALAVVWSLRAQQQLTISTDQPLTNRIVAQAEKALRQGPDWAEAQAACGLIYSLTFRLAEAEPLLRRAIQLNPSYAPAHLWLGRNLLGLGRMDEALVALKHATELDPLSHRALDNYAFTLVDAGRPQEALGFLEQALRIQPDSIQALAIKVRALADAGRLAEALPLAEQLPADLQGNEEYKIDVYGRANRRAQLEAMLASSSSPLLAYDRFLVLVTLGRHDEALAGLDQDIVNWGNADTFLFGPTLDPVRRDPRFLAVLQARGLTEAHARAQAWRAAHPPQKPEAKK